jgi:hypothetical protein
MPLPPKGADDVRAGGRPLPGRGYRAEDAPVLVGLGAAAGVAGSLVFCLYITSTDVTRLYHRPDLLWIGLPILLYVQARMWLLAGRNEYSPRRRIGRGPVDAARRTPDTSRSEKPPLRDGHPGDYPGVPVHWRAERIGGVIRRPATRNAMLAELAWTRGD